MVWEDRTPFDAMKKQFGLNENDVTEVMKENLKFSSYKLWRECAKYYITKHIKTRIHVITRFQSNLQQVISLNKILKRKKHA